jgi:multiple sugar transport system permease protein
LGTAATPISAREAPRAVGASVKSTRRLTTILTYAILLVLTLLFMGPFAFAVTTSLKTPYEIFVFPPKWIPDEWRFVNYVDAMTQAPFDLFFTNTLLITGLSMFGQITSSILVAYGFARFNFPGRNVLFMLVISTLILPEEVTIISTFLMFKEIGWLDTWFPLIVPAYFGGGAFSIFLFRQFFLTLPKDMDEAAEIDGAGTFRVLWNIILPLSKPAVATLAIFAFLGRWNDFFHPLIYLNTTEKFTISLGLRFYQQSVTYGGPATQHLLMAAAITATLPIIVVFFIFQRQFVRGIVLSGIKG